MKEKYLCFFLIKNGDGGVNASLNTNEHFDVKRYF